MEHGIGIAVPGDILLASKGASLGLPEVDVGLLGGARRDWMVERLRGGPADGCFFRN